MLREFATKSPLLIIPIGVLIGFFLIFVAVLVYVARRPASRFSSMAALPLEDDIIPSTKTEASLKQD